MVARRWEPRAGDSEVGRLLLGDDAFTCRACGRDRFVRRAILVNSRVASVVASVPDQELEGFECGACGYLHWFAAQSDE